MFFLVEKIVSLEIEKAYEELKSLLLKKGCRIIAEEPPARISVKQGSVWGISPTSAKKVLTYSLSPVASGTRISCSSSLASDWKNLTIIGSALSVIVAGSVLVDCIRFGSVYRDANAQLLELVSHGWRLR